MNVTPNDTSLVQHRTDAGLKLTGLIFAALLLPAIPASAASLVDRGPLPAVRLENATRGNDCALPQLSLRIETPLVLRSSDGHESAGETPIVENQWTAGATSEWHAGMNRAVDRLVNPPENVNVYAVQTEDHLSDRFGGPHGPDNTLAGFEIVIH
jgi:hypothetical protein